MKAPIFVIGNPRSGTTLVRLMLSAHRNILIPPECGFAVWWYEKYKNWGQSRVDEAMLLEFIRDLMQSRKIEMWNINEEHLYRFLRERKPSSYSQLVSCVYEWYGLSRGLSFERWGDKNNFHVNHILSIKTLFPEVYFVHIVRDGRDVACSYKKLNTRKIQSVYAPRLPNEVHEIARQWKANVETAAESFTLIEWENVYQLRFEDLILNTERALQDLCFQLGEEYDSSMLTYYIMNRKHELEPKDLLKWKEKTLQKPNKSEVGRYSTELTQEEIDAFQKIAGEVLRKYRYY